MDVVRINRAGYRLGCLPEVGGAICDLSYDGKDLLRPYRGDGTGSVSPREMASFPLLPYSNRLALGQFDWQGRSYRLRPNFAGSPHSLHGVGWLRPWSLQKQSADALELYLEHRPDDDWPFAFSATQRIAVGAGGLRCEIELVNEDTIDQPVGLGWHPYFVRHGDDRVHTEATTLWQNDDSGLLTGSVPCGKIDAAIDELSLDNCLSGWSQEATITGKSFTVTLRSDLEHIVLFTPKGRDYFCLEPVSHVRDAIHAPQPTARGLVVLPAGGRYSATLSIAVVRH